MMSARPLRANNPSPNTSSYTVTSKNPFKSYPGAEVSTKHFESILGRSRKIVRRRLRCKVHQLGARFKPRIKNIDIMAGSAVPPSSPIAASAEVATSAQELVSLPSAQSVNLPERSSRSWTRLKGLRHTLNKAVGELSPVKTVVEGLFDCIQIYESAAQGRKEFNELRKELEQILDELGQYFSTASSPVITTSIECICGSIQKELKYVKGQQARPVARKLAEAETDADNVLSCYRRIHNHLQRLSRNANISTWAVVDQLATDNRLEKLLPSLSACYNSAKALGLKRGSCTKGTRVNVLAQVNEWILGQDTGTTFWITGMAGTGKTTMVYTLCEQLDAAPTRMLGASFFCSRLFPECRNVELIIPSIAYQLAEYSRPFRYALDKAIEKNPSAHTRMLHLQFDALIAQPLMDFKVREAFPTNFVVVIDALDECEDTESAQQMLEVLLTKSQELPIKFVLSSRPEAAIRDQMVKNERAVGSRIVLHELDSGEVQVDIKTYINTGLAPISPSESEVNQLAERAGVLFIYAATVIRYVGHDNFRRNPHERLKRVLSNADQSRKVRNKEIDVLYETILKAAFDDLLLEEEERDEMQLVLNTVICAREPLTVGSLATLLSLEDTDRVHAALRPLWSVLHVMESTTLVATLHASFPDYILDQTRSRNYHCDATAHNEFLAQQCFGYIRDTRPQFNICKLVSSSVLDERVPDLKARVQEAIPLELYYSCRNAVTTSHLSSSICYTTLGGL
ncbi:unnamed protein product [Rhizoctonia solani]|uniref:NACHT domain-containing protein n=1 Tax=Rhizoctonia solani TaxID=456999 RepID=A0A8H3AHS2_9AGAM|nr:unnamed protein product [Rhizoctonia solani]